jgi:hypothetical protein
MNLTAKDIVLIMQRAARLGVTQLTVGEIDISFSQNRSIPQEASISQKPAAPQAIAEVPLAAVPEVVQTAEEKAVEEWRSKELQLLNGPVLDPYEWEQSQAAILENGEHQGEIEDAESVQI